MIYKNSALQDIFVKLLFIEYRLSKKIPLIGERDEWVHFNKWWNSSPISDLIITCLVRESPPGIPLVFI